MLHIALMTYNEGTAIMTARNYQLRHKSTGTLSGRYCSEGINALLDQYQEIGHADDYEIVWQGTDTVVPFVAI